MTLNFIKKRVINDKDVADLREDLLVLHGWSTVWQMPFNDLEIDVCAGLKVGKQCSKAAGKGNQILGMIR